MAESPDISHLLEQSNWLRALARRLVADSNQADDLVQDTWVSALESGPSGDLPVRGWIATVLRNGAARHRRRDDDRAHREQAVARTEPTPSAHEVVERAALHSDVVQAVLGLEEPFRTAILLRFFEQRSYAEIARQTGTTKATVNSRITRGIERLRRRLDRAYGGDRKAWVIALVPLAGKPSLLELVRYGAPQALATSQGATLMYAAIGTATAAVLVTTLSFSSSDAKPLEAPALLRTTPVSQPAEAAAELAAPPATPRELAAADREPVEAPATEQPGESRWRAQLFHAMHLSESTTTVALSSGAGDLEVLQSNDGMLRIEAEVSVRQSRVRPEQLTTQFFDHIELEESDSKVSLHDLHEGTNTGWNVDMKIYVPRAMSITAASGAGDIEILFAAGEVSASSGAGDVEIVLKDQTAHIAATAGAGDVEIEVEGLKGDLKATSGAGDVEVAARRAEPGTYVLTSGAGDVELTLPAGVVGSFDLETGAGDIEVPAELGLNVEDKGGAGRRARGSNGTGFEIKMRAGAGDVEIQIAKGSGQPI